MMTEQDIQIARWVKAIEDECAFVVGVAHRVAALTEAGAQADYTRDGTNAAQEIKGYLRELLKAVKSRPSETDGYCACGRVVSKCDGSRAACGKRVAA